MQQDVIPQVSEVNQVNQTFCGRSPTELTESESYSSHALEAHGIVYTFTTYYGMHSGRDSPIPPVTNRLLVARQA